jgi:hypothetical protein
MLMMIDELMTDDGLFTMMSLHSPSALGGVSTRGGE